MQPVDATADVAQASREDEEVARVLDAYLADVEQGCAIAPELLLARHPAIAHRLQACLAGLQLLDAGTGSNQRPLAELGEYEIVREIGRGGMGVVYEAVHGKDGRRVALKVLPFAAALDPRQLQRFKNEANAASSLRHPHIVPVFEVGCVGGTHFYTMQYVEGKSLSSIWREQRQQARKHSPASPEKGTETRQIAAEETRHGKGSLETLRWDSVEYMRAIVKLIGQAAEALDHAHHVGVIHRDVKPGNLLVDGRGQVWVTDFGLASVRGSEGLTATGDVLGTLRYMSPEQASARRGVVDHRTDIYSLGVTLYEMLTLRPALDGRDGEEMLARLSSSEPRPAGRLNAAVSHDLETVVLTAMAKAPNERYATAKLMAEDLARVLADAPVHARRPGVAARVLKWGTRHRAWVAAVGLFMLMAVVGFAVSTVIVWRALVAEEHHRGLADARQRESRQHLYAAHMNLAQEDWKSGNVARVLETLERQKPVAGEEDLRGFEWHHLLRRCQSALVNNLRGHEGAVTAVAASADGAVCVTAGEDGTVRAWNARTWQLEHTFGLDGERTNGVAVSPDSRLLAAVTATCVRVWELGSRKLIAKTSNNCGYDYAVVFTEDGKVLISSSGIVWDVGERKQIAQLKRPGQVPNCIAASPDCRTMAGGGNDGQLLVWNLTAMEEPPVELGRHSTYIHCVAFSPDGKTLLSGSEDGVVKLWDMETRRLVRYLRRHTGAVVGAAFSESSDDIATVSWDGSLKVWNCFDDHVALQQGHPGRIHAVKFTADGRRLLTGGDDGSVRVWDLDANAEPVVLSGHGGLIRGLAFSSDGQKVASGGAAGTVRQWEVNGRRQLGLYENNQRAMPAWQTADAGSGLGVRATAVMGTLFVGDEKWVAADYGGRVWVMDGRSGGVIQEMEEGEGPLWSVAISPDRKTVAGAGYRSNIVILWNVASGKKTATLSGHTDRVWSVSFSPDGRWVASGAYDRSVRVWDAVSGVHARKIELPDEWIYALAFAPDSRHVAASGGDNRLRVFDVLSGSEGESIGQHPATIRALGYFPDGRTLASAGDDGSIKLWDVSTRQELLTLQTSPPWRAVKEGELVASPSVAFSPSIWSIAISPDGQAIAAGDSSGQITIWRAGPTTP